ncbi:hypothetical protein BHE74_00014884 [Ensete ventricosum]|nr:hypothetical protein BHE74_00014884 [Ensete ventricosum]
MSWKVSRLFYVIHRRCMMVCYGCCCCGGCSTYTVKGVGEQEQRGGASSRKGGRVTLGRGDKTIEEVEERSQEKLVANWRVSTRDAMAIKRSKGSHNKLLPPGTTEGGEAIGRVAVCRALAATAHDQTWWSRAILRR